MSDPNLIHDPLITLDRAARVLGVAPLTLKDWRYKNPTWAPRAFKHGQKVRFRSSDLQACLDHHRGYLRSTVTAETFGRRLRLVVDGDEHILGVDHLLDVEEAAEYLAMSTSGLYKLRGAQDAEGPRGSIVQGRLVYRLTALNTWVEAHLEPPVAQVA